MSTSNSISGNTQDASEKATFKDIQPSVNDQENGLSPSQSYGIGHVQVSAHEKPFTAWSAMAMGHAITNSAVGILLVIGSSSYYGGAPLFFYGYAMMACVGLSVAISLGELASGLPHSGGQYFWVAQLAPPSYRRFLSYLTAVLSWASPVCVSASVCLIIPTNIFNMVTLANPNFVYHPWMGFVGYQAINFLSFWFNCFERVLSPINKGLLCFTVTMLVVIFISVLAASPVKASGSSFFADYANASTWTDGIAFLIGINGPNWSFSCLDAVVHLADEIPNPRKNIPKALLWTVAVGTTTGFMIIFAMFFAQSDPSTEDSSLTIFYGALKNNLHAAIGLETLVTMSAAGSLIGCHTWASRIAWALARDKGLPFSSHLEKLAPAPFHAPIWAHLWSTVWVALMGCIYLGSAVAFSSFVSAGILLQYITYCIPVILLLANGRSNFAHGPFWYPKIGLIANLVMVGWSSIALVFYCLPYDLPVVVTEMNYLSAVLAGAVLYAVAYYVLFGHKNFRCPSEANMVKY